MHYVARFSLHVLAYNIKRLIAIIGRVPPSGV